MSFVQRLFRGVLPKSAAAAMESSSRDWVVRCLTCGLERSIWELGGVRWGAASRGKRILVRCPTCQRLRCARVTRHEASAPDSTNG